MTPSPIPRRTFLRTGISATAGATIVPWLAHPAWAELAGTPGVPRSPGNGKVLHIIGYAHLDVAWLWPWRDGADESLNTMQSLIDRMNETPDLRYSHSSASNYRWVERADAQLFAKVKARIADKHFEVINGWIVEPDCNIPSTESLVRQGLYGQHYFKEHVGVQVVAGANPDSFGHPAGLPQLLKKAGLRYYAFRRPPAIDMPGIPLVFWWESPDGSRVLAGRILNAYHQEASDIIEQESYDTGEIQHGVDQYFQAGLDHAMFWMGVGDHGGGPTKEQIATVLKLRQNPNLPELRFSTLEDFFHAVEQSPGFANVPVVRTELQHFGRGCYSAYGEGKALNRRAERSLVQAETISLAAMLSQHHPYPSADYAEAWWKVLFCQFHDLMAGTSLYTDYADARDTVGYACEVAQTNKVEALEVLARAVDTSSVPEGCVLAFNPLPWARTAVLEYPTEPDPSEQDHPPITHLETHDGHVIPLQWRHADAMSNYEPRLYAHVDLPAGGYRMFTLEHGAAAPVGSTPAIPLLVLPTRDIGITSLAVTTSGPELLTDPIGLVVIDDRSDTWGQPTTVSFRNVIGRPTWTTTTVVEDGPLVRTTRQFAIWRSSNIALDLVQRAGVDAIELKFVIDWHEHEQMLKLEIPTTLAEPQVFAKVPGATISRETTGGEEPAQDFVAVQGRVNGQPATLGVCNAQTYSYDVLHTPRGALFRTVLIRSAPFTRHTPTPVPVNDTYAWQDQGRQERTFWIVRGLGDYTTLELERRAQELQTLAEYSVSSRHPGTAPWEQSFFALSPATVVATAIKRAEASDDLIVRLQETIGRSVRATLASAAYGWSYGLTLAPWEVKTLKVSAPTTPTATITEVNLLEEVVTLTGP